MGLLSTWFRLKFQCKHKGVQQISRNGLRICLPGWKSVQIERGPGRGLSKAPSGAWWGREAAQNRRLPVLTLPPTEKNLKTLLTALEEHVVAGCLRAAAAGRRRAAGPGRFSTGPAGRICNTWSWTTSEGPGHGHARNALKPYPLLCNDASGPEIGLPGWISAGL